MHPKGEKISVSAEVRERFRQRRIEKKLDQHELATRAGVTQGAISNFESGKSRQIYKSVYSRIYRALFGLDITGDGGSDDLWLAFVERSIGLDEQKLKAVLTVIDQLKRGP